LNEGNNVKSIVCIVSSLDAGGAETFLMKIARSLPTEEYRLDFIVSVGNGCYTQEVLARGGKIYEIPQRTKNPFGAFYGIMKTVKANQYDTVFKLGEHSLAVMDLIAAKMGGAQHLVLRSCNAPTGLSWKARFIHNFFRPILNHVATAKVAPSQLAADFMFGKNADVKLLNNGVDLEFFRYRPEEGASFRRELGIEKKLVVGHIGRFHPQKNHRYLLEIFKELHQCRQDSVLLLIGTGGLEKQIREWISEMGLQDAVVLAGQRFDIPAALSAMDVFVFPSFHEGMPNTVIEAQATGLPCVIADTITRDADLTGLVQYLPLSCPPSEWAKCAIEASALQRKDTATDFRSNGYDIESVAKNFISLLGVSGEDKK
jgi:glycosyltransferase involved in cell wall biosynthesis